VWTLERCGDLSHVTSLLAVGEEAPA